MKTKTKNQKRVDSHIRCIISGGGTGGHIFPAIAIANTIKEKDPNSEILFVGAKSKMEMQKVPQAGYKIKGLNISGFVRKPLWKNITLPFKMISSLIKAIKIILSFKPNIVIGVGGYACWPTLFAAGILHKPTLLQEQNSLAGKSNRLLSSKAKKICVAYENMDKYFPKDKIVFTGNPIRKDILVDNFDNSNTKQGTNNLKTVLITGGSLGSGTINKVTKDNLQFFVDNNINLIWATGKYYFQSIENDIKNFFNQNPKAKELIHIYQFINDMNSAYKQADIIFSRAGALSISELCCVAKATVLIPSPNVAEDHQTSNAKKLSDKGAAIMIKDCELKDKFVLTLVSLIKDQNLTNSLSENIKSLAIYDSTDRIYEQIQLIVNPNDNNEK